MSDKPIAETPKSGKVPQPRQKTVKRPPMFLPEAGQPSTVSVGHSSPADSAYQSSENGDPSPSHPMPSSPGNEPAPHYAPDFVQESESNYVLPRAQVRHESAALSSNTDGQQEPSFFGGSATGGSTLMMNHLTLPSTSSAASAFSVAPPAFEASQVHQDLGFHASLDALLAQQQVPQYQQQEQPAQAEPLFQGGNYADMGNQAFAGAQRMDARPPPPPYVAPDQPQVPPVQNNENQGYALQQHHHQAPNNQQLEEVHGSLDQHQQRMVRDLSYALHANGSQGVAQHPNPQAPPQFHHPGQMSHPRQPPPAHGGGKAPRAHPNLNGAHGHGGHPYYVPPFHHGGWGYGGYAFNGGLMSGGYAFNGGLGVYNANAHGQYYKQALTTGSSTTKAKKPKREMPPETENLSQERLKELKQKELRVVKRCKVCGKVFEEGRELINHLSVGCPEAKKNEPPTKAEKK